MKKLINLALAFFTYCSFNIEADELKVVFINPGNANGDSTGLFWSDVSRFMSAAAKDLDVELTNIHANRDHIRMKQLADKAISFAPDYFIVVNEKGAGVSLVKGLANYNLPIFILYNNFTQRELAQLSAHEKSLLIGSLVPDNFSAGMNLMADLLTIHEQKNQAKPYHLLILAGDYRTPASLERLRGAQQLLKTHEHIKVLDKTAANWSKTDAYKKTKGILQRQRIDIVWAANDPMAYGATRAAKELGLLETITVGGMNWDETNSNYPIDISYGGHVILGAKALIMVHDFHTGLMSNCQMQATENVFTKSNENNLTRFRNNTEGEKVEQFDFSRFSKSNKLPAKYQLSTFVTSFYSPMTKADNDCNSK